MFALDIYKQLEIRQLLKCWYEENQRNLPWRKTSDPYHIWISEIILQQTRVAQGVDYYLRFINKFPTIKSLSESSEQDVLKKWQGLGYYSRARNLHSAAKMIVDKYDGILPDTHKELLSLNGIGEYTAAAILSIAYNKAYAVVDGNVYRVLSRVFAIKTPIDISLGKKLFGHLAQKLLDEANPGKHNQSLMEFGALQCTPAQPQCNSCPMKNLCVARRLGLQLEFPVKQKATKVRNRYFHYFDIEIDGYTYLKKRSENDIWKNMYELPLIETDNATSLPQLIKTFLFQTMFDESDITFNINSEVKHILTHQHIYTVFYKAKVLKLHSRFDVNFLKVKICDVHMYPMSVLLHRYLERK